MAYGRLVLAFEFLLLNAIVAPSWGQVSIACDPATGPKLAGASYSTSCQATGGTAPYTWSISVGNLPLGLFLIPQSSDTAIIQGTPPFQAPGPYSYALKAQDSVGASATKAFEGFLYIGPTVLTQPTNQRVCEPASAAFFAFGTSTPAPNVQWQSSIAGSAFSDIDGANQLSLFFPSTVQAMSGNQYRAVFTNPGGKATSNPATLTVDTQLMLSVAPASQTVLDGQMATFKAAVTGGVPDIIWQVSTDGGATFADIPGATLATLTFAANSAQNANQYRAKFSNACNSITTVPAVLTVDSPPTVSTQPTNQTVCDQGTAAFMATATGNPAANVQWEVSSRGGPFTTISGATSNTLTLPGVTILMNGNQYRADFTNSSGTTTSNIATLTVGTAPSISSDPMDQTAQEGDTVAFSAESTSTLTTTVQWQVSVDGGLTFVDIPGATLATFSITLSNGLGIVDPNSGNQYRAVFTNTCGMATSRPATLVVLGSSLWWYFFN